MTPTNKSVVACNFVVEVIPPTNTSLTIPTPPSTFNAPVVVEVDCVVSSISTLPVMSTVPSNVETPLTDKVVIPVIPSPVMKNLESEAVSSLILKTPPLLTILLYK